MLHPASCQDDQPSTDPLPQAVPAQEATLTCPGGHPDLDAQQVEKDAQAALLLGTTFLPPWYTSLNHL
jgi:hypothetical protein